MMLVRTGTKYHPVRPYQNTVTQTLTQSMPFHSLKSAVQV